MNPFLFKQVLPTFPIKSYRSLAYMATFLTGFCALCSQVLWQKYLAILTGSEARSLSLVIAVFLLGLALGYYVFGLFTEYKNHSRFLILKYYGYVELLTGLYIGLFPFYFIFLKKLSFNSPNLLIFDIVVTLFALLLPTFLMGASIPMLTAALPKDSSEVNQVHAQVYGWNTLGACLGVLIAGFYLVPVFGLPLSLIFIGMLNVLSSLVFIGNSLSGDLHKAQKPVTVPSHLPNWFFMFFVFVTGALVISFEVIFVRLLNLTIGAGAYNFPIVLSLFVGALALGSLSIKNQKISMNFFIRQLFLLFFCLHIVFYTAPYWSVWMNNIRVSLITIPSNYPVWFILIFLFLSVFLFPAIFFMGRLLPLAYIFLNKTEKNYGKLCGSLYFCNTLGTVFGAVVIGYLAFYFFNLDGLFKANLYVLFLLIFAVVLFRKVRRDFVILSLLGLALLAQPLWDRKGHELGFFKSRVYNPRIHFRGLFNIPNRKQNNRVTAFFRDGPNTTVSLFKFPTVSSSETLDSLKALFMAEMKVFSSYSMIVNGKSDGNSLGDFSTVFSLMSLPYLHFKTELNPSSVAVIGLGTGLTAGLFGRLDDVKNVDVLEISPFVIKALETVNPELNFNVMFNPKVQVVVTDAFKHFTKQNKKYDIVVSEPSNLWVMGVENLFTIEFYDLVSQKLSDNGIFTQWLHTYNMEYSSLELIIKTIHEVFPYAILYRVGLGDIAIVASQSPLENLSQKRFNNSLIKKFYSSLGIQQVEDIYISQVLDQNQFYQKAKISPESFNSLYQPKMIFKANKSFFMGNTASIYAMDEKYHIKEKSGTPKMEVFKRLQRRDWQKRCLKINGFSFMCVDMLNYIEAYKKLQESEVENEKFATYLSLRKLGLIPYNQKTIDSFLKFSLKEKNQHFVNLAGLINDLIHVQEYHKAQNTVLALKNNKLVDETQYTHFQTDMARMLKIHKNLKQTIE